VGVASQTVAVCYRRFFVESALPRAEGPAVNSPTREGGDSQDPVIWGPKNRHFDSTAPSALMAVKPNFLRSSFYQSRLSALGSILNRQRSA